MYTRALLALLRSRRSGHCTLHALSLLCVGGCGSVQCMSCCCCYSFFPSSLLQCVIENERRWKETSWLPSIIPSLSPCIMVSLHCHPLSLRACPRDWTLQFSLSDQSPLVASQSPARYFLLACLPVCRPLPMFTSLDYKERDRQRDRLVIWDLCFCCFGSGFFFLNEGLLESGWSFTFFVSTWFFPKKISHSEWDFGWEKDTFDGSLTDGVNKVNFDWN